MRLAPLGLAIVGIALTGCGSGSDSSGPPNDPTMQPEDTSGANGNAGPGDRVRLRSGKTRGYSGASILWSQTLGPTVVLSDATEEEPTFTAPIVPDGVEADLSFRMTLTTTGGATVTDDVSVTVQPLNAIVFSANVDGSSGDTLHLFRPDTGEITSLSGPTVPGGGVERWRWSPDQRTIAYRGDMSVVGTDEAYVVDIAEATPVQVSQVADLTGQITKAVWSPDGSRYSYLGDVGTAGQEEAFSVLPTASDLQSLAPVTMTGGDLRDLVWTPDSSRVIVRGEMATVGTFEVYSSNPDGSGSVRLHAAPTAGGSVSRIMLTPDGTRVVMQGDLVTDGTEELFTCEPDGSNFTNLSVPLVAGGTVEQFVVSPDGQWIAYTADGDTDGVIELYTVRVDGSSQRKVSPAPAGAGDVYQYVEWSPNSQFIVFEGDLVTQNFYDLQRVRPDGSGHVILASQPDASSYIVQWEISPSSQHVSLQMSRSGGEMDFGICRTDGVGGHVVVGSTYDALFTAAVWNEDGSRYLTNSHHESLGDDHLYSAAPADTSLTRISGPVTAGNRLGGFWLSPDGSLVSYTLDEDNDGRYDGYVVPIAGGTRIKVTPDGPGATSTLDVLWSRDSQWLAIRGDAVTPLEFRLWFCRATGADLQLVPHPFTENGDVRSAAWSVTDR